MQNANPQKHSTTRGDPTLVVIVGINGRQGTSVANAFLENGGYRVRGLTSSPDCPSSDRWRQLGVEIREETFMDHQHIHVSFEGAHIIFATTCYYSIFRNRRLKLAFSVGMMNSKSVSQYAMERDIHVGHMILDAAANIPQLQKLVMSTLPVLRTDVKYATAKSKGEFAAKRQQIQHLQNSLPELWNKTILVKLAPRMEDFDFSLRLLEDGTLSFGTAASAHASLFWLNMSKDFGILVRTLVERLPCQTFAFAAYSDKVSGEEICQLISKISGETCIYQEQRYETPEGYEEDIVCKVLPAPPGNILYDQQVLTPISFNEMYKQHNIAIQQTSFEEYLIAALPSCLEKLRGTTSENPTCLHQTCPDPIAAGLSKVLQENQNVLDGMEELPDESVEQISQVGRQEGLPAAILRDQFMGVRATDTIRDCTELFEPGQKNIDSLMQEFGVRK